MLSINNEGFVSIQFLQEHKYTGKEHNGSGYFAMKKKNKQFLCFMVLCTFRRNVNLITSSGAQL